MNHLTNYLYGSLLQRPFLVIELVGRFFVTTKQGLNFQMNTQKFILIPEVSLEILWPYQWFQTTTLGSHITSSVNSEIHYLIVAH